MSALLISAGQADEAAAPRILDSLCSECHEGNSAKGDFSLDALAIEADAARIFRVLDHGEMPPADETQLTREEFRQLLAWLEIGTRPDALGGLRDPGKPVLRRLNRLEYNNTIRDLAGLDTDLFAVPERLNYARTYFDPASAKMPDEIHVPAREFGLEAPSLLPEISLPADTRAERGFMNRGDALNLSPMRLEKLIEVATRFVEHPDLLAKAPKLRPLFEAENSEAARRDFLARALRRPLTKAEFNPTPDHSEDANAFLRRILTNPQFLYLAESFDPEQGAVRPLNSAELASRLSYFLWSSMPDEQLLAADLGDPAELARQAGRLLRDPKVKSFTESFATQWLRLHDLLGAQPDPKRFKSYYFGEKGKRTLTQDLLLEPILFFETVLVEDRSILEFIDSDWLYLNHLLIDLYELEDVVPGFLARIEGTPGRDSKWIRVQLPDKRRGGVLTMGAFLTQNSTPLRTSPVYRGNWVATTMLNRPPPPPPAAVAELPPDDKRFHGRGLTLRDFMREHRENPACARCHERIDPLGLAFENYNAIGRWRAGYNLTLEIDASGSLFGGRREFDGAEEFKAALLAEREIFVRGFVKQLLSYALGRELIIADEFAVDEIVAAAAERDFRLPAILAAITASYPFRHTRNLPPP